MTTVSARQQSSPSRTSSISAKQWLLVIGGAGVIGSRLARALLIDGYEIDVADDLSTGAVENVSEGARLTCAIYSSPAP